MAIGGILSRASSFVAPFASRAVRTRGSFLHRNSSVLSIPSMCGSRISKGTREWTTPGSSFLFSSQAAAEVVDKELVEVLKYEIKCAQEGDLHDEPEEIPEGFPFEVEDHPGNNMVSLKRKYDDETITVDVHMPDLVTGEDDDKDDNDDGGDDDDETESMKGSRLTLVVNVSKKGGIGLEFVCSAYPDEVVIDSMSVKEEGSEDELAYEGPEFSDLDENLQKAFHKYLEVRGIKPSSTNFLHEYMINKDSIEYLRWLKKVKEIVSN